jgi:hypothetical protein
MTRDPSGLLENKLEQLNSLLWCSYGAGDGWFQDAGRRIGRICFGLLLIWRGRLWSCFRRVGVGDVLQH